MLMFAIGYCAPSNEYLNLKKKMQKTIKKTLMNMLFFSRYNLVSDLESNK